MAALAMTGLLTVAAIRQKDSRDKRFLLARVCRDHMFRQALQPTAR
jgi:hypothetical protein